MMDFMGRDIDLNSNIDLEGWSVTSSVVNDKYAYITFGTPAFLETYLGVSQGTYVINTLVYTFIASDNEL